MTPVPQPFYDRELMREGRVDFFHDCRRFQHDGSAKRYGVDTNRCSTLSLISPGEEFYATGLYACPDAPALGDADEACEIHRAVESIRRNASVSLRDGPWVILTVPAACVLSNIFTEDHEQDATRESEREMRPHDPLRTIRLVDAFSIAPQGKSLKLTQLNEILVTFDGVPRVRPLFVRVFMVGTKFLLDRF